MSEKLKPCPFCGSEDIFFGLEFYRPNDERHCVWDCKSALEDFHDNPESYKNYPVDILCLACNTHVKIQKDIPEAVEAWNRRASDGEG